eukprot:scaffold11624_cov18-Tisochrysis_lutea.AAC.1
MFCGACSLRVPTSRFFSAIHTVSGMPKMPHVLEENHVMSNLLSVPAIEVMTFSQTTLDYLPGRSKEGFLGPLYCGALAGLQVLHTALFY